MAFKIFLSPPNMGGAEMKYVQEAFDTNWIAPYGPSINAFEREMAAYVGVESALALTSGTAAIHLALRWYGIGAVIQCSAPTLRSQEAAIPSSIRMPNRFSLIAN